jgi:hypothetical protein
LPHDLDVQKELFSHLSTAELASLTGVDRATARRWRAHGRLPRHVNRLLAIITLGQLDAIGWKGWRIMRGVLVSPEGWEATPGDVLALPFMRQQIAILQADARAWRAVDEQPVGGATEALLAIR